MKRLTDREDAPIPLQSPWLDAEGISHGFFTRQGGVSQGIYAGLNAGLGSGDDPEAVRANRARLASRIGVAPAMLVSPWQFHSADAIIVEAPFPGERPRADALVTATPGLAIGVLTADCGPVLFADPECGVVAAAHAGWKGALDGILENTVETMIRAGARRGSIRAVLGPSIDRESYEVGPEFVERFLAADPAHEAFFVQARRPGHSLFDLPRFILMRLERAGIQAQRIDRSTYRDEAVFYSYRRSTHRGESDYGRQLSAIAWMGAQ